jgi:hypothetical protein
MDHAKRASRILITRSGEDFSLVLPIKTQPFRRLLYAVWLAVWLVSEAGLVAGLAGWKAFPPLPEAGLVVMLTLFSAAGAFIAWRFLWYQWGREVYSVDHHALRVRRDIAGVGRTSIIPLDKIRRVRAESMHYQAVYPSWGRLFIGHGDSQILLNSGAGPVAYGRGLEGPEAADLAELLNEEVRIRTDEKQPSQTRAGGA